MNCKYKFDRTQCKSNGGIMLSVNVNVKKFMYVTEKDFICKYYGWLSVMKL